MPHDKNGEELKVGDVVHLKCTITHLSENAEYCNCTIQSVEPVHPSNHQTGTIVSLNTKQVEKCGDQGTLGSN